MPRISYSEKDFLPQGWKPASSYIGDLAKHASSFFEGRKKDETERAKLGLSEKRLALEEQRAKTQLLREENAAAVHAERADMRDADRTTVMRKLVEQEEAEKRRAFGKHIREALASPGGAIGPFGALARGGARGMAAAAEIAQRTQANVSLASRMSTSDARGFLTEEAEADKRRVVAQGFMEELAALNDATLEGKISPERAKEYNEALQSSIRDHRGPGELNELLAREYDLHAKLTTRMSDWEQADVQAGEMIDSLRKLASEAPAGVDPETGEDYRAELLEKLASAKVEWNRTKPAEGGQPVFRSKNDAGDSMAGLQKILFGAQIGAGEAQQDAFLSRHTAEVQDADRARRGGVAPFAPRPKTAQDAPGARRAPGGLGGRRARGDQGAGAAEAVREFVLGKARSILESGGDRKERIMALREAIQRELGLDPDSPEIVAAVKNALQSAYQR